MSEYYDIQDSTGETNELDTLIMNVEPAYNQLLVAAADCDMTRSDAEELVTDLTAQGCLEHVSDDFDWGQVNYDDLARYWNQGVEWRDNNASAVDGAGDE